MAREIDIDLTQLDLYLVINVSVERTPSIFRATTQKTKAGKLETSAADCEHGR
jgi:hypothetical protein